MTISSMMPLKFMMRFLTLHVSRFWELFFWSATSHQLRLLRDRGLVAAKRDGRRVIYSLADDHVITLISVGLAHAAHQH